MRLYAVNSKQVGGRSEEKRRSTKNSFLDGSFLTCCVAGPFCRNFPLSTNDLEDGGEASRKGEWGFI
jgi:hypothetical protein